MHRLSVAGMYPLVYSTKPMAEVLLKLNVAVLSIE